MLKSISWGDYFSTLTFLLIVYYIFVAYVYFKYELLNLAGITKQQPGGIEGTYTANMAATQRSEPVENDATSFSEDVDISPVVQEFINETESYLEQAAANKAAKQEVLFALQKIAARYPVLSGSDYKTALLKDVHSLAAHYFPNAFALSDIRPYLFS